MRVLFLFIFLFYQQYGVCQQKQLESIYRQASIVQVMKYNFRSDYEYIVLGSEFSKEKVEKIPIRERRIIQIDLVYTAYHESPQFSQKDLNMARIEKLLQFNPEITENKFFEWRLVEQTGCNSSGQCRDFFHGFVVYYDKYYTKDDMKEEIDTINHIMSQFENQLTRMDSLKHYEITDLPCDLPPLNYSLGHISDEFKKYYQCDERFNGMVFFTVRMDDKGRPVDVEVKGTLFPCKELLASILKHILRWRRGLILNGSTYPLLIDGKVTFPLGKECITFGDFSIPEDLAKKYNAEVRGLDCAAFRVDSFYTEIIPKIDKEAVSTVLFRNHWDSDLIIVDATGSMYPYTSDLLKWLRLSTRKERTYVFFNDGDDKATSQKIIGQTGGINHVTTDSYLGVRAGLFDTMRKGGGGDLLENNIEALLYGVKVSGQEDAIMIVDNYSYPRDVELLKNYHGHLRIILCGTTRGINTHYLDLARHYGFSIHTLTSDLPELKSMKTGQQIKIGEFAYELSTDGFHQLIL